MVCLANYQNQLPVCIYFKADERDSGERETNFLMSLSKTAIPKFLHFIQGTELFTVFLRGVKNNISHIL